MGPAVLFYSSEGGTCSAQYSRALTQFGFRIFDCPDTRSLRHALRHELQRARNTSEPIMAVLASSAPSNRSAVSILTATPQVGVLACVDGCDDATLVATLQLGVDAWCPRDSSPELLALTLHGLKRRLERGVFAGAESSQARGPSFGVRASGEAWVLKDQGWALEAPDGASIRLTSSERQFLMCLAGQSDRSASHAQLLRAIGRKVSDDRTILSVLVSRLRRKVAKHGELPIQSVHNRGYMFSGGMAV